MDKLIIGCGYLGERVARAWIGAGVEVAALTRSAATAQRFRELGITPIMGDVLQPESLAALPAADIVLYAVGYDRTSGFSQREVYVTGLENVLRQISSTTRRFLYVSSTSVYGQSAGELVDETSTAHPTRPNGQVCLEAEEVVWRFFPRSSSRVAEMMASELGSQPDSNGEPRTANVLRLAGLYGPGRLLARIEALRSGAPLSGNPDAFLNLIHVEDAVSAVLACENRGRGGELYLVCDDLPVRRREYFAALAAWAGAPPVRFAPTAPDDPEAANLNKRCVNRKLRTELEVQLAFPTFASAISSYLTQL